MGLYSFKVFSKTEVDLPGQLVTVGEGHDVFSARIDDLESFTEYLRLEGITVLSAHQLDAHEAIQPIPEIRALQGKLAPQLGGVNEREGILGSEADDVHRSEG